MIGFLTGELRECGPESALILCQGVGYEVLLNQRLAAELMASVGPTGKRLSSSQGAEVSLWIYTHVREDALQLFGFETRADKELFLALLKVNGVGPKMAMNALSGATANQIHAMIESEDVKALSKLPKVGKKTAEQMILTLKGKLVLEPRGEPVELSSSGEGSSEVRSALVHLGFKPTDVDKVVKQLPAGIDFEEGLRKGLSALTEGI